jgi:hypothetical protein
MRTVSFVELAMNQMAMENRQALKSLLRVSRALRASDGAVLTALENVSLLIGPAITPAQGSWKRAEP